MTPEILATVTDLGTTGLLIIAVVYLWRKVETLTTQLLAALANNSANIAQANLDRKEILSTVTELKFWADYKGDDPSTDAEVALARRSPPNSH